MVRLLSWREERDGASHGAVTEYAGRGSTLHFDTVYIGRVNAVPIHPAAKRIIDWNAVPEHQRAARAGRSGGAQRDALCRWIGDHARRAAKQAEAGYLA